jgi:hypothetical protein
MGFRRTRRTNEPCIEVSCERISTCDSCRDSVNLKSPKMLKLLLRMLARGLAANVLSPVPAPKKVIFFIISDFYANTFANFNFFVNLF